MAYALRNFVRIGLCSRIPVCRSLKPWYYFVSRRMASTSVNYERFFNAQTKRREPSPIRALQPLLGIPGMISLGGGLPNPTLFPLASLSFTLKDGTRVDLSKEDLEVALQYSASYGLPSLLEALKAHQIQLHKPQRSADQWAIMITTGSQDGLYKAFDTLLEHGESVLVETPTYSGALTVLKPMGARLVGVPTDNDGIIPEQLDALLAGWHTSSEHRGHALPKLLYTIPTGQNPSGCSLTVDRKRRLLDIASKYDLLLLEDDPYYALRFAEDGGDAVLPPSLFSLDREGRVLRFDSLSKLVSAGLRLGWVTGPRTVLSKLELYQQAACLHASGLSQAVVLALLRTWGDQGWLRTVAAAQRAYRERRDWLLEAAARHLGGPQPLASWTVPRAGMFVWFKCHGVHDTAELVTKQAVEKKVLFVPGTAFDPNGGPSPYLRASYSTASREEMEEAMKRLADLLREARQSK